jgi:hypothetical protein
MSAWAFVMSRPQLSAIAKIAESLIERHSHVPDVSRWRTLGYDLGFEGTSAIREEQTCLIKAVILRSRRRR